MSGSGHISGLQIREFFATPIGRVDNLVGESDRRALAALLLSTEESDRTLPARRDYKVGYSNTGWHSEGWTEQNAPECVRALLDRIRACVENLVEALLPKVPSYSTRVHIVEYSTVAWGVINRKGDWNLPHIHTTRARDTWSAVFYADAGTPDTGGSVRFFNPSLAYRSSLGTMLSQFNVSGGYVDVHPSSGSCLLFPGWLEHEVLPYEGATPRIVLAANVGIFKMKRIIGEGPTAKTVEVY